MRRLTRAAQWTALVLAATLLSLLVLWLLSVMVGWPSTW